MMNAGDRVVIFTVPDGISQTGTFRYRSKSDPDYAIVETDNGSQLYHLAFVAPDTEVNRKEIDSTCKEVKRLQNQASTLIITIRQRLTI